MACVVVLAKSGTKNEPFLPFNDSVTLCQRNSWLPPCILRIPMVLCMPPLLCQSKWQFKWAKNCMCVPFWNVLLRQRLVLCASNVNVD